MAVHERVWERTESRRPQPMAEWKPVGTYTLLGIIAGVFLLQNIVVAASPRMHQAIFVIDTDWLLRPWSLITSTVSHGSLGHLLANGLVLYFFGGIAERLLGLKRFLVLFFITGAVTGVLQTHLSAVLHALRFDQSIASALVPWQDTAAPGALGASGALLFVFGFLMILMPNQTILLFFIIPIPFWLAGILFALLDVLGALDPSSNVGNFAHLAGLGLGIWYATRFRADMRRRGMRLVY